VDFNKYIKELIALYLNLIGFNLKNEINGVLSFENEILTISFSYDFRVSFEADMYILFKSNEDTYAYSEMRECLFDEKDDYIATQIVDDIILLQWVGEVKTFLQNNLSQINDNSFEISLKLEKLHAKKSKEYAIERDYKLLNEKVEKFWQAKDYAKLVL